MILIAFVVDFCRGIAYSFIVFVSTSLQTSTNPLIKLLVFVEALKSSVVIFKYATTCLKSFASGAYSAKSFMILLSISLVLLVMFLI
jgi:hypothetical protein